MIAPVPLPPPASVRDDGPECVSPECAAVSRFRTGTGTPEFRTFATRRNDDQSDVRLTFTPSPFPVVRTLVCEVVARVADKPTRIDETDVLAEPL